MPGRPRAGKTAPLRELARFLPQLGGLLARLLQDRRVPRRTKAILALAAAYLASPVDLVPDFVPFAGYLDDVIVVAVVLDGLLNHVDRELVRQHWPGDPASLDRAAEIAARVSAWLPQRFKARLFGGRRGPAP